MHDYRVRLISFNDTYRVGDVIKDIYYNEITVFIYEFNSTNLTTTKQLRLFINHNILINGNPKSRFFMPSDYLL